MAVVVTDKTKLKGLFLSLPAGEQAVCYERLIGALTNQARRGYSRSQTISDPGRLIVINEIIHSVAGFLVQFRLAPDTARADFLWDTLIHKAVGTQMETELPRVLQELFDSRDEAVRLAKLARPVSDNARRAVASKVVAAGHGVSEAAAPYGSPGTQK